MADNCCKAGISQVSYFNWKKKCGGMLPPDMRRPNRLEDDNLKRLRNPPPGCLFHSIVTASIAPMPISRSSKPMACARQ